MPDGGDPALNVAMTVATCRVPVCVVDPAYASPVVALTMLYPASTQDPLPGNWVFTHGLDGPVIAAGRPVCPDAPTAISEAWARVAVVPDVHDSGVVELFTLPVLVLSSDPPAAYTPETS